MITLKYRSFTEAWSVSKDRRPFTTDDASIIAGDQDASIIATGRNLDNRRRQWRLQRHRYRLGNSRMRTEIRFKQIFLF